MIDNVIVQDSIRGWVRLLPHLILQMIKIEDGIASCYGCMNTHVHVDHATRTGQIKLYSYHSSDMRYLSVSNFSSPLERLQEFKLPESAVHWRCAAMLSFRSRKLISDDKIRAIGGLETQEDAHPFLVSVKMIRAEYESIHSRKLQVLDATKAQ
ncbi:hypothetical protein QL285_022463 [Trifolium repens]|nr:hypothetical protein QL285_022463 [Trifolium repens]